MTFSLKNDNITLEFVAFGGALSSIKDADGLEYLWQGDATYWSGQAPVLFPICGGLRNDQAVLHGQEISMPRHGLVRKHDFEVLEQNDQSITFSIKSSEDMYAQFPYKFELQIRYDLLEQGVRTNYIVKNLDDKTMPFFVGGHPGFNCPLLPDETYEDYYLEFEEVETMSVPEVYPDSGLIDVSIRSPFMENSKRLDLDYSLFAKDSVALDQLQSRSVKLLSKKHDKGLQLDFADFPYLILWSTTNKGPFIALEPWSGLSSDPSKSDDFLDKDGVRFVEPGQEDILSFDIHIL